MTVTALRRLLIVCFCASGAAALIYQVAWVRLLTLALGHTVAAASTVLAAFMGGLAAGAWAAGRLEPPRNPSLARYAALELIIAAVAVVLPAALAAFDPVLIAAYADGNAPASFALARIAVSFLLIGVPAAAMGATYPIAVAWLVRLDADDTQGHRSTSAAGVLYSANSAGAAAGAVLAGFWLIELFGVRGTTWVAVALNVFAAGLALWFGRSGSLPTAASRAVPLKRRKGQPNPAIRASRPIVAMVAAATSGFAALVYEVAWTRLLALALGPTTYAFATMAAAFITGIALGSSLAVRLTRRVSQPVPWLAVMLVATSMTTIIAAWFTASYLPLVVARSVATHTDFSSLFLRQTLAIGLVLLPASISLGATFTLALSTASSGIDSAARETAHVYSANTVGAVAGAFAAGFMLVPRFGLQTTFLYASTALLVTGGAIAALASPSAKRLRPGFALLLVAIGTAITVAFGVSGWDRDLITSGAYKYARQVPIENLESSLRAGRLEYYKEGAAGTVSVRSVAGSRSLAIDGKVDASNGADMLTQRLLGLLPTMLHAGPRDALVIGLGSGVTADAVLASREVRHLDVVEISPEVVEASRLFSRENHNVLENPATRLLVADGRTHLRLSARQYDVIISEPSNPWMAGVSALFTREFFEAARARLRSGGIFCQWSHTYEIGERDLQSIVRTFASVFPGGTMWLVGEGDLLLIGSAGSSVDEQLARLPGRSSIGAVPERLEDVGIPAVAAPFVLLSLFAGGPKELALFGDDAALQVDDRMALEFSAARAMHAPPAGLGARLRSLAEGAALPGVVASVMRQAGSDDWTARGEAELRAEAFAAAHDSFRTAVRLDSRSARALRGATGAAAGLRRVTAEAEWLKTVAIAEPTNAAVRVELSHVTATLGDADTAVAAALDAVSIEPSSPAPLEQLASIFADVGDAPRLQSAADDLIARFPERSDGRYYRAVALFLAERPADAERAAQALLGADPRHAKGLNLLGVICASRGDRECARRWFTKSLEVNPRDPSVYVNLGKLSLENRDAAAAAEFFGEALTIDPADEAARSGLAEASNISPQRR